MGASPVRMVTETISTSLHSVTSLACLFAICFHIYSLVVLFKDRESSTRRTTLMCLLITEILLLLRCIFYSGFYLHIIGSFIYDRIGIFLNTFGLLYLACLHLLTYDTYSTIRWSLRSNIGECEKRSKIFLFISFLLTVCFAVISAFSTMPIRM